MQKELEKPLKTAIDFLESHGLRYAVIGGIAASYWGAVRVTKDVDLKVIVPGIDFSAMRKLLRTAFPQRGRPHVPESVYVIDVNIEDVIVDFLLAVPGYEEQLIQRAVRGDLDRFSAWICTAEDLIIQKVYAGRGKDLSDIEVLLARHRGKLDEAYIEDWVGQFAEALEQPELLADYKKLVARIKAL